MEKDNCENCNSSKTRIVESATEGENVCSVCGWCDPDRISSFVPQNSKEFFQPEKHYYVRKPKRGKTPGFGLVSHSRGSGQYDRRYYWNERFGQWQNHCPLINQKHLIKIGSPIYTREHGSVARFYMSDPLNLTRDDISLLCRHAKLNQHAEKWIQIKWCLTNFPLWKYQDEIDNDLPIPIVRRTTNFAPEWRWKPDFLPDFINQKLRHFLNDLRSAFMEIQKKIHEIEALQPYLRKSFINFDFVMQRGLYMLCDQCDWDKHGVSDKCWVVKYSWALKSLNTPKNLRDHTAWFYFLVGEMAKKTLYEHPSNRSVKKWEICPSDSLLVDEKYKPKCPLLLKAIIPPTFNPDLAAQPLKQSGIRYRRLLGQVGFPLPLDTNKSQNHILSSLPC